MSVIHCEQRHILVKVQYTVVRVLKIGKTQANNNWSSWVNGERWSVVCGKLPPAARASKWRFTVTHLPLGNRANPAWNWRHTANGGFPSPTSAPRFLVCSGTSPKRVRYSGDWWVAESVAFVVDRVRWSVLDNGYPDLVDLDVWSAVRVRLFRAASGTKRRPVDGVGHGVERQRCWSEDGFTGYFTCQEVRTTNVLFFQLCSKSTLNSCTRYRPVVNYRRLSYILFCYLTHAYAITRKKT